MRGNMSTGFQNKNHWMRAAKRLSALLVALVTFALTGCGEPAAPGLGLVTVNGGADAEIEFTGISSGGVCNFVGSTIFVQLIVTKQDADLGNVQFGADTILDLTPLPNVEPVTNALVTILGIDSVFLVQHSTNANAQFFSDPTLVLPTPNGIASVRTGSDGVSYLAVSIDPGGGAAFASFPEGVTVTNDVEVVPSSPAGEGMRIIMTFTCDAP